MIPDYEYVTDAEDLGRIANEIDQAPVVALDTETLSLDPHKGGVRLFQINTGKSVNVVDMARTKTLGPIRDALHNPECKVGKGHPVVVGHNLKFDQKMLLRHYDTLMWPVFDTMRASYLIHNGRNKPHDLESLCIRDLGISVDAPPMGASDWSRKELSQVQLDYAAEDVQHLMPLRDELKPKLASLGLNRIALLEFQAILPESSIELNGFRLDKASWLKLAKKNEAEFKLLQDVLLRELPHPRGQLGLFGDMGTVWNLNSTEQLQQSLARLDIDVDSTKEEVLAMLAGEHPIVQKIIDYKKASKRISSFGPDYLEHINPVTGRIHTSFYPYTGAGRYSSSNPNLQQIPRLKAFRDCFRTLPGWILVLADYGQIELRLAAQLTQDPTLLEVFRSGLDPHRKTGGIVSSVAYEKVTDDQRQEAKPLNFGLLYGLGAKKLVIYAQKNYGVAMSFREARTFVRKFFEGYPFIRYWQDLVLAQGQATGRSYTPAGRLRYLDKDTARNEFFNTPIQGAGADGLKAALWCVYHRMRKYGDDVKMVHMVHDEIVCECRDDPELISSVKADLEDGMREGMAPLIPDVPCEVDANSGYSWAEAK